MNDDLVGVEDFTDLILPFVWDWLPPIIPDLRLVWFLPTIDGLESECFSSADLQKIIGVRIHI